MELNKLRMQKYKNRLPLGKRYVLRSVLKGELQNSKGTLFLELRGKESCMCKENTVTVSRASSADNLA